MPSRKSRVHWSFLKETKLSSSKWRLRTLRSKKSSSKNYLLIFTVRKLIQQKLNQIVVEINLLILSKEQKKIVHLIDFIRWNDTVFWSARVQCFINHFFSSNQTSISECRQLVWYLKWKKKTSVKLLLFVKISFMPIFSTETYTWQDGVCISYVNWFLISVVLWLVFVSIKMSSSLI